MKLDFSGIINFNKKFKRAIELKNKKEEELKKSNEGLEKLEQQLNKLIEKEYKISAKLPDEQVSIKLEDNRAKQETKKDAINKKKERISALEKTYKTYEGRYLKLYSEKKSGIIDLDVKIAKLEDKIDELRKKWDKAAEKVNENYAKMRKINKDSQEYKELEEENEKHREIMKNSVITSETGMKLKNELEELKNMRRILENGEIIEELVKPKEEIGKNKSEEKIEEDSPEQEESKLDNSTIEDKRQIDDKNSTDKVHVSEQTKEQTVNKPKQKSQRTIVPQTTKEQKRSETSVKQKIEQQKPPIIDEIPVEPVKEEQKRVEQKITKKTYSEMTEEELKKKQRELFARIIEGDEYYFRVHEENGMEGYESDKLDAELKAVREELEKRNKEKQQETKEEPILEAPVTQTTQRESLFKRFVNTLKNFVHRFTNRNQQALPAPEITKEQQAEYVEKANRILEETVATKRIFEANTRYAMRKK